MGLFQRIRRLKELTDAPVDVNTPAPIKGDGKAVFFSDATEEEYDRYIHEEVQGWKKFYRRYLPHG